MTQKIRSGGISRLIVRQMSPIGEHRRSCVSGAVSSGGQIDPAAPEEPRRRQRTRSCSGARSQRWAVLFRRGAMTPAARADAKACDMELRQVGAIRTESPLRFVDHVDRPQCDVAHQPDLGHIPAIGERFRDEREFAPAQIVRVGRLVHP